MKVAYSECAFEQYKRYPYVVWATIEDDETIHYPLKLGFLPSRSGSFPHYYLCRSVRVDLQNLRVIGTHKRILSRCPATRVTVEPISTFEKSDEYENALFRQCSIIGVDPMFVDSRYFQGNRDGYINYICTIESGNLNKVRSFISLSIDEKLSSVHYCFCLPGVSAKAGEMGKVALHNCAKFLRDQGYGHLYLGTCYTRKSQYKVQFNSVEFFSGISWNSDRKSLMLLIESDQYRDPSHHAFENDFHSKLVELSPDFALRLSSQDCVERG